MVTAVLGIFVFIFFQIYPLFQKAAVEEIRTTELRKEDFRILGLDEWSDADRVVLTDALIASEVPHRWDGTTVVVASDAEHAVDDLLDAIEAGELLGDGGDGAQAPPEGVLSTIFLAADRLAKDPMDATARTDLVDLAPLIDAKTPPYGMAHRPWAGAVGGVDVLVELIEADAVTGSPGDTAESDIIGAAQELRSLLRP